MSKHRAALVFAAAATTALAGCGTAAHAQHPSDPPPALTVAQASTVQSAYDKGNNTVNHGYDVSGVDRLETLPLRAASQAWLVIRRTQRQPIPSSTQSGGTFLLPPADGYPRWFVSVGVRVRGGVPSSRPVYTVFTQQAAGAPWLASYTDDPNDTVPAVRTNAAGAVAAPASTSGLLMDPADLSAAIFAHAMAPTTPTDRFAHTAALDDQLSAGIHVGAQTLADKGWTYHRVLDPTGFPRYLLTTTDGGVLAFTATVVVDTMEAPAGHQVVLDAGSNEAALDGHPGGTSARQFTIRRLQTFLTYIPPKGSGQKVQVLAYNDAPISVHSVSALAPSRSAAPGGSPTPRHHPSRAPEPSKSEATGRPQADPPPSR